VVVVQALSHYFLYPNRPIYDDVTLIRESRSRLARLRALQRFYQRGIRLVSVQNRNPAYRTLEQYPQAFRPVFRSATDQVETPFRSTIYLLDGASLELAIRAAQSQ